ncbi:MAG: molybdenum cofactor biosynthesis protein MoaE [Chloroflexota bacterium]
MIELTQEPIRIESVMDRVKQNTCGAVVTFTGTVRDNFQGKRVLYMEYDAYPEMATKKLAEITSEIQTRWGLADVAITHRVGRVEIGEVVVVIAVASAHRLEAFQACQYAIDRIKKVVPIWKKEFYEDGSSWIDDETKTA